MWISPSAIALLVALQPSSFDVAARRGLERDAPPPAERRQTSQADDDRPFTRLLPNLAHDIVSLPSRQTVLLLLAGTAGAVGASTSDGDADFWAARNGRSDLSRFGAAAGDGWVQGSFALGTYVIGAMAGADSLSHVGSDLMRAQILNGLVTQGLKYGIDRARPGGGGGSFPSGHTSASFTTAAVLQGHYGWKAGGPAFALATLVGWSRVRDRAHWASDIVSGATLGTIVGLTVTKGHRDRTWIVAPTAVPGGVAITLVRNR